MPYTPTETLPATTPGGLATGVDGERLGATDVAADGTRGAAVSGGTPTDIGTVTIAAPKATAGNGSGALRYPRSRSMVPSTDYIVFEFFEYEPPFGRAARRSAAPTAIADSVSAGYNAYQGNRGAKKYDPIILYMPEDIQTQFSARWGAAGFGASAIGMMKVVGTDISAIPSGFESIPGVVKSAIFDEAKKKINEFTGSSITSEQIMGGISGTIINPNVEMMYEAPDLRTFSLSFKMTPHDQTEATEIRKICQRFKKALMPEFGGGAIFGTVTAPNLITIPPLCQVTFMKGIRPHPSLPQYKLCALVNVDVNYTPDGSYATFGNADGSPVATSLTIQFKETKVIFSQEVKEDGASF